jgi:hypothetical protein
MKSTKRQETKSTIRFSAKLLGLALTLPKSASAKFPSRGKTMVEGVINNLPFRVAFEPDSTGSHSLKMSKAMQNAIGAADGDLVTVEITRAVASPKRALASRRRVGEEPETRVPMDLRKALAAIPSAQAGWAEITPMARRDWIFSICTAKLLETRTKRIEKACDMLASGKRRLCCFPGIKWMMEKNATSWGMWLSLASSKGHFSAGSKKSG